MSLLLPHVVTTLFAAVLLALVHGYLLQTQATDALRLWTIAWSVYALRFVAAMVQVLRPELQSMLWLNQVAGVVSGFLLLWGALRHTGSVARLPLYWLACALALVVWLSIAVPLGVAEIILYTPVFVFLACANFAIAVAYLRTPEFSRASRTFVAAVFVLWGVHKLDYPVLRGIPEMARWGYAIGAAFTMAAGVGLLTAYLEQARSTARAHRRRFEGLVESLNDIVFTLDRHGRHTGVYGTWTDSVPGGADAFLGRTAEEIFGPEEGHRHVRNALAAFAADAPITYEWSVGEGEEERFYQTTLSPVRVRQGPPRELVGIGRDITELKKTQYRLEHSLAEKATLLKEVHHRVKNNLQIIVSLLRLQSREVGDEDSRRSFEDTMARVASMAEVHERLYESDDLASVPFAEYLSDLSSRILEMYGTDGARPAVEVTGDANKLNVATAIPLGLIATELISNAAKHAVGGRADGRIEVTFYAAGEDELQLSVADNGPGLPEDFDPATVSSLGMALVLSLCDQLAGRLDWESEHGTWFAVTVPRPQEVDENTQD